MNIHRYKVQHDTGFAPNPFGGACTLACCKPAIRKRAQIGDYIIGFASASREINMPGQVIYWMKVDEILDFNAYWNDPRFESKKPQMAGGLIGCYGDNIYHRDKLTDEWIQENSFHKDGEGLGRGNLANDTGKTDNVLISKTFAYWGENAPHFPNHLTHLIPPKQGDRYNATDEENQAILNWIQSTQDHGIHGWPVDWARKHTQNPNQLTLMI